VESFTRKAGSGGDIAFGLIGALSRTATCSNMQQHSSGFVGKNGALMKLQSERMAEFPGQPSL